MSQQVYLNQLVKVFSFSSLCILSFFYFSLLLIYLMNLLFILVEVLEGLDNQFGTMDSLLEQEIQKQKIEQLTKENIFNYLLLYFIIFYYILIYFNIV